MYKYTVIQDSLINCGILVTYVYTGISESRAVKATVSYRENKPK